MLAANERKYDLLVILVVAHQNADLPASAFLAANKTGQV
jgi:hypothetical protein